MKNMRHTKSYHLGHPNPQKYRKHFVSLNGTWKFVFDEDNIGIRQEFYKQFPLDYLNITVPYPYQAKASGICLSDKQCNVIWYEKEFEIDNIELCNVMTFLGVDYLTSVFINGEYVLTHEGGYDSFEVDLSKHVKKGINKVTLRVEDTMRIDQIRGKQRWRKDSFTCFYLETSGIVRDVYIEQLEKKHIHNFIFKADYLTKTLSVEISAPIKTTLDVIVSDIDGNKIKNQSFVFNKEKEEFILNFKSIKAWSYEDPYLYNVELVLSDEGKEVDRIISYCGFTTVGYKDSKIYINGKPTYLKFVLNQGYWVDTILTPTEEEIKEDCKYILDCGFNGARMHEHIPTPLNFYYLDLLGLYIWQECPSAHGYSYDAYKQYFKQFPKLIKEHQSHPSIIAYVLWNESWGINEIKESIEIQKMTEDMYNFIKPLVNGRLVISNDGWEHTTSDVITFHNYAESYDELHSFFDGNLKKIINGENAECIRNYKNFFAGEYRYKSQPIMYSEFAGIAFSKDDNSGWGYGKSVGTPADFLKKYDEMLHFIKDHLEICGFCMTQLTDVYQEKNGIFTMNREEKVPANKLKELHERFN